MASEVEESLQRITHFADLVASHTPYSGPHCNTVKRQNLD